ncbi:uncharacterized protein RHO25_012226 [Cercospora beticola]|uniref:NB-ARC domain-containing protein n=1 Tax=Cercospora beticola TaxID=122368 RepID=A0ABZ0P729_CERBT|nr:hypothetical protein RHO25_012226 [Cercospora beticola]
MLERLGDDIGEKLIDIIVVPGIGAVRPDDWPWLQTVNKTTRSAQLWSFRYGTDYAKNSMVEYIERHAEILLADLETYYHQTQDRRPICFVCHSLGGLVLQQALKHVHDCQYSYLTVSKTLSGIIFLGTPHKAFNSTSNNVFESIMNCFHLGSGKPISSSDLIELDQLGRHFEGSSLSIPVLSVYERYKTKVKFKARMLFSYHREQTIVGEAQVQLSFTASEAIGAPLDHRHVALLPRESEAELKALAMITKLAREAPSEVAARFEDHEIPTELIHSTSCGPSEPDLVVLRADIRKSRYAPHHDRNGSYGSADAVTGTTDDSFEVVARRTPVEMSKPPARLPPSVTTVRPMSKELFGRAEDLLIMDEKLLSLGPASPPDLSLSGLRSFVIYGMGGIGKTSLAQYWVQTRKHNFDAVFWLKASKIESLAGEFVGIGTSIGLFRAEESHDLAVGRAIVKGWLAEPRYVAPNKAARSPEARWLIVFDDVESLAGLAEYWPFEGQGTVLVTTRDASSSSILDSEATFARSLPLSGTLELKPLTLAETRMMLLSLTAETSDCQDAATLETICRKLGGLPLAIQQMAGNIRTMNLRYGDLLRMWEHENPGEFLDTAAGSNSVTSTGLRQTIATMWMSRADTSDRPEDLALLRVLSFLAPGGVSEELVCDKEFLEAAIPQFRASELRFQNAKLNLIQSSRITYEKKDRVIIVHDLVKESVRAHMGQDAASYMLLMVARAVSRTWPFLKARQWHDRSRWPQCETLLPHIAFLQQLWSRPSHKNPHGQLYLEFAKLINEAGWFLYERGMPEESKKYFATVEIICRQNRDQDAAQVSEILRCCYNYQGAAATDTGDREGALVYNRKWLELHLEHKTRTEQTCADHEEACIWNETGLAYGLNQEFVEAEACFRRSAEIIRTLPDFVPTMLDYALPNLGLVLWVQGKPLDAESVLSEIREACEEEYGFDDVKTFKFVSMRSVT